VRDVLLLVALIAVFVGTLVWCVLTPTRNYHVDLHRRRRDLDMRRTLLIAVSHSRQSAQCPLSPQLRKYRCNALSVAKGQSRHFAMQKTASLSAHHEGHHRLAD
jgi:hypothetical protein